jgi:hypothetical protein
MPLSKSEKSSSILATMARCSGRDGKGKGSSENAFFDISLKVVPLAFCSAKFFEDFK